MTVKELIKLLKKLPPNSEVICQKDSEGNGYSPLAGADGDCVYQKDTSYSGTVFSARWTAEEADMEEEDWQEMLEQQRCVVLYPTN